MDRRHPPEQADILFGAVKGVYGPQNTPMLWRFIIAGALWGPYTPSTPPKITSASLEGCKLFIRSVGAERKASCGALGGHFTRRRPWLWRLWRHLCYVIRLLKISIKILKLVVCIQCLYVELYIVKHIIIHVLLVVASTEPKLYGGRSPNHFGPMDPGILGIAGKLLSLWERFSHCTEAKVLEYIKKERKGYPHHTYLELLIRGDVCCPAFEFIYIYFSVVLFMCFQPCPNG